jgi:DNA (cytosine-5)-methyltransferase 1
LYAGIGGNRKLWPNDEIEVTAIEIDKHIAGVYSDFFPNDKVIVTDAHEYLLKHFEEYDFIWSSPPCPTHSRMEFLHDVQECEKRYPDMKLYEEIIFLKTWFKGKWCVENVISYYEPLIKPYERGNHYFWTNFYIPPFLEKVKRGIREDYDFNEKKTGFNIRKYNGIDKRKILNNCVEPKLGLHIWNCAFKEKQLKLKVSE